jgi:hypothetical protein
MLWCPPGRHVTQKKRLSDLLATGHSEEQILSDLRRLTEDTRKVRLELESLVRHSVHDGSRSFSDDRGQRKGKNRRKR